MPRGGPRPAGAVGRPAPAAADRSTSADLPAEVVFCDPPYAMVADPNARADLFEALERLLGGWIAPGAVLMLHHAPMPYALWPTERLVETDRRIYGRSQLTFFDVPGEGADG